MIVDVKNSEFVPPRILDPSLEPMPRDGVIFRRVETGNQSSSQSVANGYFELRERVYRDELGILELAQNNRDIDSDDERSRHFVALRSMGDGFDVVGAMRLIVRSTINERSLPIESFFAGELTVSKPEKAFEVSRFISRHPDRRQRNLVRMALIRIGLSDAIYDDLGRSFAIIEKPFFRLLRASGVPTRQIGPERYIEHYRTSNFAAEIDINDYASIIGKRAVASTRVADESSLRLENIIWQS